MNIYHVIINNSGAELPEHDEEWWAEAEHMMEAVANVLSDPDQDYESLFDDAGLVIKARVIAKDKTMSEFEDENPDFFFT